MKRTSAGILAIGLMLPLTVSAENVYRWADENGEVHYGRTLPPEYANKPHEILNSAGIVIERVTDPLENLKPKPKSKAEAEAEQKANEPEPLFTPAEVRLRSDNLLMLRYHSEEELIAAMENEVAQLGYDSRLLNQSSAGVFESLRSRIRDAADRERAGMPQDEQLNEEIRKLRNRIRRNDASIAALQGREREIRENFEKSLARYRFLSAGGKPGAAEID